MFLPLEMAGEIVLLLNIMFRIHIGNMNFPFVFPNPLSPSPLVLKEEHPIYTKC